MSIQHYFNITELGTMRDNLMNKGSHPLPAITAGLDKAICLLNKKSENGNAAPTILDGLESTLEFFEKLVSPIFGELYKEKLTNVLEILSEDSGNTGLEKSKIIRKIQIIFINFEISDLFLKAQISNSNINDQNEKELTQRIIGAINAEVAIQELFRGVDPLKRDAMIREIGSSIDYLDCSNLEKGNALKLINFCPNLSTLVLTGCEIDDMWITDLVKFAVLPKLTVLDLSTNKIGPTGAAILAEWEFLNELICLKLDDNCIGDEGVTALVNSKYLKKKLIGLGLSSNQIGPRGAATLAHSSILMGLHYLGLGHNKIGPQGAAGLACSTVLMGLEYPSLIGLDLVDNQIGNQGMIALAATGFLKKLKILDLGSNQIGDEGVEAFVKFRLLQLKELSLWDNKIGNKGMIALADPDFFAGLTHLGLARNRIGDESMKTLASSIQTLATSNVLTLELLDFRSNEIGSEGTEILDKVLNNLGHVKPSVLFKTPRITYI